MKFKRKDKSHQKSIRKKRLVYFHNGRLYFSSQLERRVFFVLTLAMLLWGIWEKCAHF